MQAKDSMCYLRAWYTVHWFRCPNRQCSALSCSCWTALTHGSIFEDTKVPTQKLLHLIYYFAFQVNSLELLRYETGHSFAPKTRAHYIEVLRRLLCDDLFEHKKPIGGPELTVQIDEIMVYHRKNHKGRVMLQDWVISGVCVETKESLMYHAGNRSTDELYRDWIKTQSRIVTDCWCDYPEVTRCLQVSSHQTVNHPSNFMDPKTGACTNRVEGFWSVFKRWLCKRDCFTGSRKMLNLYMGEFLWRQEHKNKDPFKTLLAAFRRRASAREAKAGNPDQLNN